MCVCVCVCVCVLFTGIHFVCACKVWRPKFCDGNLIFKLVDTTGNLDIEPNFTHCNLNVFKSCFCTFFDVDLSHN